VFIARAVCGLTHVTVATLCSSCGLLCISNSDWATENEAGRSVSVNGNEEPRWRDLSPIQFKCNWNYSLITHNKTPVHCTWGLLRVCAVCQTTRLNLSFELRPFRNNIQDTFPTGFTQDTRAVSNRLHNWNMQLSRSSEWSVAYKLFYSYVSVLTQEAWHTLQCKLYVCQFLSLQKSWSPISRFLSRV